MTTFLDGPAKGKTLMLKRAARFLRVVENDGSFDALDQPCDVPTPNEKLYAYTVVGDVGHCHIHASRGRGGFYPIANYKLVEAQPTEAEMRDNASWRAWCERNA